MKRISVGSLRPAYASLVVILTMGVLAFLLMALAVYGESQRVNERNAELASRADFILISARDWSAAHTDELRSAGEKELPLDGLLPETHAGTLVLRFDETSVQSSSVTCDLVLHHGDDSITRDATWPVAAPRP